MYTITILRSSPKSKTSFTDMLDSKRSKFGPKKAKMGMDNFFPDCKPQFSKKDHKNSFHTKNYQNLMNPLKDIG